jgi:hypothetical protein
MQEDPSDDLSLSIRPVLWIHFLVIDDHVTSRGHESVPGISARVGDDELTKGID